MANEGEYVPERFDDRHFRILIRTDTCCSCDQPVVPELQRHHGGPFPVYYAANFKAQTARAGIRLVASYPDGKPLCVECKKAGLAEVRCALCKQQRSTELIHESYGDPAEHLCVPCYEITPAKLWAETVAALEESHQYDFE